MIPATQETSITMTINIKLDLVALRKSVRESVLRYDLHADERSAFVIDEDDLETAVRHIVYQKHDYVPEVKVNGYYQGGNESLRIRLMDFGEMDFYEKLALKHYREKSISYKTQMEVLEAKWAAEKAERKRKEEEEKAEALRVRQDVPEMTKRYDALMAEMEALKKRVNQLPLGQLYDAVKDVNETISDTKAISKSLKYSSSKLIDKMKELVEESNEITKGFDFPK